MITILEKKTNRLLCYDCFFEKEKFHPCAQCEETCNNEDGSPCICSDNGEYKVLWVIQWSPTVPCDQCGKKLNQTTPGEGE